jgi:hypothetical protein
LTDELLRDELLAASARSVAVHSWDKTAQRAIAAYERLEPVVAARRARLRKPLVAVVGPLPPVASVVAEYTARVLDEIDGELLDIDVYADSAPADRWPPAVQARRVFPATALGASTNPHDYDVIMYCLGASASHIDTLRALRRWPGIVWMHDTNLVGVYRAWAERHRWELKYGWHGERKDRSVDEILRDEARATYDEADYARRGLSFAACAVAKARHVIVNSPAARDLIVADLAASSLAGDGGVSISVLAGAFADVAAQLVEIVESTIAASSRPFISGAC